MLAIIRPDMGLWSHGTGLFLRHIWPDSMRKNFQWCWGWRFNSDCTAISVRDRAGKESWDGGEHLYGPPAEFFDNR